MKYFMVEQDKDGAFYETLLNARNMEQAITAAEYHLKKYLTPRERRQQQQWVAGVITRNYRDAVDILDSAKELEEL